MLSNTILFAVASAITLGVSSADAAAIPDKRTFGWSWSWNTPARTTKMVTSNNWSYDHCHLFSVNALTGYKFSSNSMTADMCATTCEKKGYCYAGVMGADDCFCGNGLTAGWKLDDDLCKVYACDGDKSTNCGGLLALQVYSRGSAYNSASAAAASTSASLSAAAASTSASISASIASASSKASAAAAASTSASISASVASASSKASAAAASTSASISASIASASAAAASNAASVSASISASISASAAAASTSASVSASIASASAAASAAAASTSASISASIASASASAAAAASTAIPSPWVAASTSCVAEGTTGRALIGAYLSDDTSLTYSKCISFCDGQGFAISALEFGRECFCGNSLVNGASLNLPSTQCNKPCSGSAGSICGGPDALTVFVNPAKVAGLASDLTVKPVALPAGWSASSPACIAEGTTGRAQTGAFTTSATMTPTECISYCANQGFTMAGTQFGNECRCSNSLENGASLSLPSTQCTKPCVGNGDLTCGGPQAFNLYVKA